MSHYSSPTPLNVDIRVDAKNGKNKCTLKPPLHNCQPHHNKITKAEKFAAYIRIFIQTFFFSVNHLFSRGLKMVGTPKRDIEMKPTFFRNRRSQFPKLLFLSQTFPPLGKSARADRKLFSMQFLILLGAATTTSAANLS